MDLQKKVDEIIKTLMQPIFKSNGFKKTGRNWYKDLGEFGWCFNIQSSLYNSQDEIGFTFNTGIFVEKSYKLVNNGSLPKFPKEYECVIRKRIGTIKKKNDIWYQLNGETNIDDLKFIIQNDIEGYIIPYFNTFISIENIVDTLNGTHYSINELAVLALYGNRKVFEEIVNNIICKYRHDVENEGYVNNVIELTKSLEISIKM
jgi:hypothetical protein